MITDYGANITERGLLRKIVDTCSGYIRIDIIEDRMFPLATGLRFFAVVFPVFLYYFQSSFLHLGNRQYAFMLIGTAVTVGLADALGGLTYRLQFAQERGTLETYLVEPVPWAMIPLAMNIWRSLTGSLLACVMVTVGWLVGAPIRGSGVPLALVALFLGVAVCNALGAMAASFLILFKRGEPVITVYSLAAGVLGGALFPVGTLPGSIRWASYLVPHSYVIDAVRNLLIGTPSGNGLSPLGSIGVLLGLCVVCFTVGLFLFDRSLQLARRLGVLAT